MRGMGYGDAPVAGSGVLNIPALRMLKANGWWNDYWKSQREQWAQRAQGLARMHNLRDPS